MTDLTGVAWANCRATVGGPSGFTTDSPDTYLLGNDTPTASGRLIGGVYGMGLSSDVNSTSDDDGTYASSPHFAGRIGINSGQEIKITNLIVGHTYDVYLSLGVPSNTVTTGFRLSSATGAGGTMYKSISGTSVSGGSFMDVQGAIWSGPTNWLANAGKVSFSAASTDLFLCKAADGANLYVNTIGIKDTTAGASTLSTSMMMGV